MQTFIVSNLNLIMPFPETKRQTTFTPSLIEALKRHWAEVTIYWRKEQLLAGLGYINTLVHQIANEARAIAKTKGFAPGTTKHRIVEPGLAGLLEKAQEGALTVRSALTGMSVQIKKFWAGACHDRKLLRNLRTQLVEIGLFQCEGGVFAPNHNKRSPVPLIEGVNLEMMLVFYEHLEEMYCGKKWGQQWEQRDELPKHKGKLTRLIYNAVFRGVRAFREEYVETTNLESEETEGRLTDKAMVECLDNVANRGVQEVTIIPTEDGRMPSISLFEDSIPVEELLGEFPLIELPY